MRNKVLKLFIFITSIIIIAFLLTIFFFEYNNFILVTLAIILLIDILLIIQNSIRIRYYFMNNKKAIIYADLSNSKLITYYYGIELSNKIFGEIYSIIDKNVKNGCAKRKFKNHYVILLKYENKHDITNLINKISNDVHHIKYNDVFNLAIKFGIQICDKETYEEAENKAELACNKAKHDLLNTYCYYNDEDAEYQLEEKKDINRLINALKNNEFDVYYQPKYDYKQNKIIGSEALVRLIQDGEVVPASEFIDVAEKYNFTVALDKYVLKEVCKKIQKLKKDKIEFNTISINVSRSTLCEDNMMNYYLNILEEYGVKRGEIELEITERESIYSNNLGQIIHNLCNKFDVSVDDFGMGSSSLEMLTENNIKTIKIDRRFVTDESDTGRKILNNIIKLSKDLDFELVAEGVETEEQKDYLKSRGCHVMQGYYYSRPLPYDDYEKLLKE